MNFLKGLGCRIYQGAFRIMLPFLPYREPKILKSNKDLANKLKELAITNVLLVTDSGLKKLGLTAELEKAIKDKGIQLHIYDRTVPNPTTNNVAEALEMYNSFHCEAIVAFGGGSPMDCAKAVGARVVRPNKPPSKMKGVLKVMKKLPPLFAIPTTAGTGSETTIAAVITDSETRHKYAINDFSLIPHYAMLDEKLTFGLPPHITATTGMDALTHAVEAYIGRSTTKKTRQNAKDAVKLIFENLENAYHNGNNKLARANMLKASYLAGLAFTKSYVGYVHAVAHSLGGKYNIAHGLANAVLLPVVLKKYGKRIYKKLWQLGLYARLFATDTPIEQGAKLFIKKIEKMNKAMNIPTNFPELNRMDIPALAVTASKESNPLYPVPVLYNAEQLEEIYRQVLVKV